MNKKIEWFIAIASGLAIVAILLTGCQTTVRDPSFWLEVFQNY